MKGATEMSSHEHAAHPHGDLANQDVHHEESDINVRALLWFVIVLTVIVLGVDVVCWGMFKLMNRYEASHEPYVTPLGVKVGEQPPEPRLQTTPWTDLKQLRAQEHEYLNSYGWVDQRMGVARIPIAKAKEMLLQKGIAVRPELGDATEGTHIQATGESNGGRTLPAGAADKSTPAGAAAAPPSAPAAPSKPGGGQ
jgi:hypothetical protein